MDSALTPSLMRLQGPDAVLGENLLVIGKNSYIGGYIATAATYLGAQVKAVGSEDCDFLDGAAVERFFRHLPAQSYSVVFLAVINKTVDNSFESLQRNLAVVKNFATAQAAAKINSVVYFSSVDVYGRAPELPVSENSPIRPDSWYGLAKFGCEWILCQSGLVQAPVTVLRSPGVFGPGMNDRSVIGQIVESVRSHRPVTIHGSGNARRDYVHVDDVFQIVRTAVQRRHRGVLNAATGQSYPISELASLVAEEFGEVLEIAHRPAFEERDFDLEFDNSAIQALIPGFVFKDIRHAIATYRN